MADFLQTTHRDISWFKQADELNQLEMRPPFQRNLVWTKKQKSFLVDSILNGFPIPELYMQDIILEDGSKNYIVVDGQQRITSCLEYIHGEFEIDGKDSPSLGGLSFDDLNANQKKKFYGYQFVVRMLPEISDLELREIFQRLNRNNVVLNPQELRQATYWGEFINLMNGLANHDLWSKIDVFTSTDIKRMKDVEFISELAIAVLHGVQNKKQTLDKYYELYEEDFKEKFELQDKFDKVLREITKILPNISDTRWSKKTDFYTLFVLLSKYSELFPLSTENRAKTAETLMKFAQDIDKFVRVEKEEGAAAEMSENVIQYTLNLRASSDLGARRKRQEALDSELNLMG
ncbi:DUF262 domain-containing protein [Winogradskyella sp. R77965]|uniref:DUF262 domain-containing protein n=1 Tax=Winogradskyella sp. R77965 TaxID=3093872 RepID=UPI0037DD4800